VSCTPSVVAFGIELGSSDTRTGAVTATWPALQITPRGADVVSPRSARGVRLEDAHCVGIQFDQRRRF
jgi:hypothetical protein